MKNVRSNKYEKPEFIENENKIEMIEYDDFFNSENYEEPP